MNLVLLLFVCAAAILAACAWLSPDLLERIARTAFARACALRDSRAVYHATYAESGRNFSRFVGGLGVLVIVAGIAALVAMPQ